MAEITVAELAVSIRATANPSAIPTEIAAELGRLLGWATTTIDNAAADVPEEIRNQAITLLVGYVWDRPSASRGVAFSNAWRNSGASSTLKPYLKTLRAFPIGDAAEDTQSGTTPTPSGPGVDETARAAAAAAQALATANANKLMPPNNDEADAATATRIRGWTAALIRRVVESIVPAWARMASPPEGSAGAIADGSVTTPKLADDAVTSRKLAAEAVTEGIIADGAVTGRKIPRDTIDQDHIAANAVGNSELAGNAVEEENLAAGLLAKVNARITGLGKVRAVVNSITPATIESSIPGENDGDLAIGYTASTVAIFRYAAPPTNEWQELARWSREVPSTGRTDTELEAFIETIVSSWAIKGNADGIPGPKTFDGLFKSEQQTPLPGANARIAFDVGNAADADVVDETDAEDTSFNITAEQANQSGAFIRVRYRSGGVQVKARPTDVELLLQVRDTGAVIGKHNLPLTGASTEGTAQFPIGDAGAKRWAVRVVTAGSYKGEIIIEGATYHSAQSLADPAIEHVVHPIVSREAEERQEEDDRLTKEIARVEAIKAIVNGLPAAQAIRKGAIVYRTDKEYEQTVDDAFQVPATGFVQFILGNIGTTPITPVEYCVNRKEIVYAVGNHEISVNYNADRKAIISALNTRTNKRSSLFQDIVPNAPNGLRMLTWAPARASGHATTELADLEQRVEKLEEGGGSVIPAVRAAVGLSGNTTLGADVIGKIVPVYAFNRKVTLTLGKDIGEDGDKFWIDAVAIRTTSTAQVELKAPTGQSFNQQMINVAGQTDFGSIAALALVFAASPADRDGRIITLQKVAGVWIVRQGVWQ